MQTMMGQYRIAASRVWMCAEIADGHLQNWDKKETVGQGKRFPGFLQVNMVQSMEPKEWKKRFTNVDLLV